MKTFNKRDDIIKAALELFAEHGFHKVSMAMVARKAGVGTRTIYRHFPSKDNLITDLYNGLEEKLLTEIREGYPANSHPKARFTYLCTAIFRYFLNNPLSFRYMEQQYRNSPSEVALRLGSLMERLRRNDMFRDIFKPGAKHEDLKDLPLFIHFSLALGPLYILARDYVLGLNTLDDKIIDKVVEACWDGMKR